MNETDGLWVIIVKSIVIAHNGYVNIESIKVTISIRKIKILNK